MTVCEGGSWAPGLRNEPCVFFLTYTRSRPKRWDAGVTGVPARDPNDAMGKRGRASKHGVVGTARDVGPRRATGTWAPEVRYCSLREERFGQGRRPGWAAEREPGGGAHHRPLQSGATRKGSK